MELPTEAPSAPLETEVSISMSQKGHPLPPLLIWKSLVGVKTAIIMTLEEGGTSTAC